MLNFQVGAADYIAVARNYHTVFISQVPVMSMKIRDKVFLLISTLSIGVINFALLFLFCYLLVLSCDSGSKIYNTNR